MKRFFKRFNIPDTPQRASLDVAFGCVFAVFLLMLLPLGLAIILWRKLCSIPKTVSHS